MTLKTIPVQVELLGPNGAPLVNAKVKATLSTYELDGGIVVPTEVFSLTNRSGIAVLNLWPNARGQASSRYQVTAVVNGELALDVAIAVPDSAAGVAVPLRLLIDAAPYPLVSASQQALLDLQLAQTGIEASRQAAQTAAQEAQAAAQVSLDAYPGIAAAYLDSVTNIQELRTLFLNYIATHP
jgi:hypothetical protein